MSQKISHSGVVESISESCIKVRILQTSACAGCKVAGHCNASEAKEKIVDVLNADATTLKVGDSVMVYASWNVANRALLFGFGLPFLVMIGMLFLVLQITSNEGLAALFALLALLPYYGCVYLCRDKIERQMAFYIE